MEMYGSNKSKDCNLWSQIVWSFFNLTIYLCDHFGSFWCMSNLTLPQVETSCCWTSVHLSQPEGKSPPQDFVLGGIINHPNWVLTSNFCIPIDAIDVAILFISCLGVHVFSKGVIITMLQTSRTWDIPPIHNVYIYIVYIDIDIFTLYIFSIDL